jgi:hypothetical protein
MVHRNLSGRDVQQGEALLGMAGRRASVFRTHASAESDYNKYHGHNYPFIGWEELTTWPSKDCFVVMLSTNRTTNPNVPKMIRATTNPHGVGHNWVKSDTSCRLRKAKSFGELCVAET